MKVYVTRPLPEPSVSELLADFDVEIGVEGEGLSRLAPHVDALLPMPTDAVSRAFVERAPRLRIVANCAVGTDNIDLQACRERGIVVTNTPGVLTEATADLTWALILALTRRLLEGEALVRSGDWDGWEPMELLGFGLQGKTLGIYGAGRIGQAVARRAVAFGMDVFTFTSRDGPERFEELLERSDVLSLHAPLTPATRLRFGRAEFSRMKRGAFFVNTARGGLMDESAVVDALERGQLGGAALDVYQHEPRVDARLVERSDVVLLPHIGSATRETRLRMARLACEEIRRVLSGEPPVNRVV